MRFGLVFLVGLNDVVLRYEPDYYDHGYVYGQYGENGHANYPDI